jgi:hypothetical protein
MGRADKRLFTRKSKLDNFSLSELLNSLYNGLKNLDRKYGGFVSQ